MKTVKAGPYCRTLDRNGEKIYEHSNHSFWKLKERFYRAGYQAWPEAVKRGESPHGFSLNDSIYSTIPLKKLIIFEKKTSTFFKLANLQKLRKLKSTENRNGIKLHVLSLSAFVNVQIEDIHNLIHSIMNLSKTELITTQQKLEMVS